MNFILTQQHPLPGICCKGDTPQISFTQISLECDFTVITTTVIRQLCHIAPKKNSKLHCLHCVRCIASASLCQIVFLSNHYLWYSTITEENRTFWQMMHFFAVIFQCTLKVLLELTSNYNRFICVAIVAYDLMGVYLTWLVPMKFFCISK